MARNGDKPGKLSVLEKRVQKRRSWDRILKAQHLSRPVAINWTINIISGLLILLIINQPERKMAHNVYTLPENEGEPIIAIRDFKLPKDLEVPDVEGTEQKKNEAASRVPSYYDWDPQTETKIQDKISAFFEGFRGLYPPPLEEDRGAPETPDSMPITVPASFKPEMEKQLLRDLGIDLKAEDLEILQDHHFDSRLEQTAKSLVEAVYKGKEGTTTYVVPNRELLLKERDLGIMAQRINPKPENTPVAIKNLDPILDINSGQEIIGRVAKEKFEDLDKPARDVLVKMAKALLEPNLTLNKNRTEEAKVEAHAAVKPLYYKFKKDEVIVRKGDRLSPDKIKKIDAILAAQKSHGYPNVIRSGALLVLIVILISSVVTFATRNVRKFRLEPKDMIFLSLTMVLSLAILKGIDGLAYAVQANFTNFPEGVNFFYIISLAGSVMLVRMVLNSEIAVVFAIVISIFGAMAADNSLLFGVYTFVGSIFAAGEVKQCRQRSTILRAGLVLGFVNALLILAIGMITKQFFDPDAYMIKMGMIVNMFFGFAGGIFVSIIITGVVPIAEYFFSYATDIKLLELLNQDHPLLKDLSMRAPGTHQHSLMVANLAEEASKAINANPLLARVCAMYHDIGKMNKAGYFAENQWDGENVHDRLAPSMSTLIIHKHVKEGMEMAEKYKLPRQVLEAIQQHHGTSLLKFFFEKAKELNESGSQVDEIEFRYPGPKPQNRETAIILLADVIESAARTVRDPNPARMQGMVQKLINRFFIDGQLDECDLTLKNLHDIARSFNTTLGAIYHNRPDYPQPVVKSSQEKKKKAEQDAAGPKDKLQAKNGDEQQKDKEESENYLKRLGM